jgi:hypothetical protein
MALNRDKFRKIVGGITTAPEPQEAAADAALPATADIAPAESKGAPAGQEPAARESNGADDQTGAGETRRFAKRGRPKGRKDDMAAAKTRKVRVSLFLDETIINDLYDWAHADRIHPGEMFEKALKPFHEKEAKRRNAGKG